MRRKGIESAGMLFSPIRASVTILSAIVDIRKSGSGEPSPVRGRLSGARSTGPSRGSARRDLALRPVRESCNLTAVLGLHCSLAGASLFGVTHEREDADRGIRRA